MPLEKRAGVSTQRDTLDMGELDGERRHWQYADSHYRIERTRRIGNVAMQEQKAEIVGRVESGENINRILVLDRVQCWMRVLPRTWPDLRRHSSPIGKTRS